MKKHMKAFVAIVSIMLAGCSGSPLSRDAGEVTCTPGSRRVGSVCVQDVVKENCSGTVDTDGDGLVPAVDPDCHPDGGMYPTGPCDSYCKLMTDIMFVQGDGGRSYYYGDGGLVETGPGVTQFEVGLPSAVALKVCYSANADTDGDGIRNKDDNCWLHSNKPRGCTSNSGCRHAGNACLIPDGGSVGTCAKQLDTDDDGLGDNGGSEPLCDPDVGANNADMLCMIRDADPDFDGIPIGEDHCPDTQTTREENETDSNGDGVPDVCQ